MIRKMNVEIEIDVTCGQIIPISDIEKEVVKTLSNSKTIYSKMMPKYKSYIALNIVSAVIKHNPIIKEDGNA